VVTEPDMRSSKEAVAYAKALHGLVVWLGVCDGNMQEGSFRCDANVSVRHKGKHEFGTRCEIKNLNSFRFVEKAILHEVGRQIDIIEGGGSIVQETRLYDPDRDETRSMRSKEEANDYRYFPDPDLLPLLISAEDIAEVKRTLPELPDDKARRFVAEYGLSGYDAGVLTATRELADYFETVATGCGDAKLAANWVMGELSAALNRESRDVVDSPVAAADLVGLLRRVLDETLSGKLAKEVFAAMWGGEGSADAIIEARGLKQVTDSGAIEAIVEQIVAAHPTEAEQLRSGKEKVLGFFVGQVMKATQGKANPAQVNQLLRKKLLGS
jgi:aspartyl-tRNA(Asn)/glutamyl-tRNA(Gln) amidotransferase subunit B